ncbi:MAG: ferritin [Opitutales bacterium]
MIKKEIEQAINQQIQQEFSAAYTYLGMAAYFENENLSGFSHWCRVQSREEVEHAMRLFDYLISREGSVRLEAIGEPSCNYGSAREVFKAALDQERANTESIDKLYELAASANDHATISHLQWFVDEQVEEESTVGEVLSLVERAANDANALLYLNDKLGARSQEET